MSDVAPQASFNSGEWSPSLRARVDMQKYRSGAALLENFFVDYRGGASTRPGTRYIIQARDSANPVRLIPFQATSEIGYILEFGNFYIRFIFNGSMVLENAFALTAATQANPCVITIPGHNFVAGDTIFISGVVGMTQLNGRYFNVLAVAGDNVSLLNLNNVNINATGYTPYVSGGTVARVYTMASPYAGAQLAQIKFAQSFNQMILCHPNIAPQVLVENSPISWTLNPAVFGSTASPPAFSLVTSSLGGGTVNYAYVVTSVDANGQESLPSAVQNVLGLQDMRTVAGSIQLTVAPAVGAVSYNFYKADVSYIGVVPSGSTFGFIGSTTGTSFVDTNIGPDYTQTPPIAANPFVGAGVQSIAVTAPGVYTTVPVVTIVGAASIVASAAALLQVQGTPTVGVGGGGYVAGDRVQFANNVVLVVATVAAGAVTAWSPITAMFSSPGQVTTGSTPANPVPQLSTTGAGTGATANLVWGVGQVVVTNAGSGYAVTPTVSFSSGAATATATVLPGSNGNPTVPGFFQQRLVLAGAPGSPQTFYMSQTGNFFNFNQSSPPKEDDEIEGTLVSGALNTIKSIVSSTSGMLLMTDKASWIVNGGASGTKVTPAAAVANAQSYNGANDVPPIVANYDILYVQEKGSSIRDLAFNIYFNVFTGTDISIISSHLFFGYQILEWAWAEEPFKVVWAIRDDGVMLTLTFLKEQEFIGWAHQATDGNFKSVAVVTEAQTAAGVVDAVYTVVERVVAGNTVKYIERVAERIFPNGVIDAFCVDAGLAYTGAPATHFTGGEHLAGLTVTGLADGEIIPPFVMPASGEFTLAAASVVNVGRGYTCKLQTLPLDIGEPSVQGKVKKIPSIDIRVADTLNLLIGPDFDHLQPMTDLRVGQVSRMLTGLNSSQVVADLVDGDAEEYIDSAYTVYGQYCIQQSDPMPASVLGVFPRVVIGDDR